MKLNKVFSSCLSRHKIYLIDQGGGERREKGERGKEGEGEGEGKEEQAWWLMSIVFTLGREAEAGGSPQVLSNLD